jgi:ubiquinone biosynthesis protein UbiJ
MITERVQALLDEKVAGSLRVVARHTPWEVTVLAEGGRARLLREDSAGAEVTLAGTPLAMLSLLRGDPADVIRRGDVSLTGDGEAGTRFQELALLLRPEMEEGLSRIIGDVPAFGVGSLLRKAMAWGRASAATQAANFGEYLAHEKRVLVPGAEARQYIEGVDSLREQADRLAARIAHLEAKHE